MLQERDAIFPAAFSALRIVELEPRPMAIWGWYPCSPQSSCAMPIGKLPIVKFEFRVILSVIMDIGGYD